MASLEMKNTGDEGEGKNQIAFDFLVSCMACFGVQIEASFSFTLPTSRGCKVSNTHGLFFPTSTSIDE